jgi:hypothetical protein
MYKPLCLKKSPLRSEKTHRTWKQSANHIYETWYKELLQLKNKSNPIKKLAKDLKDFSPRKIYK